MQSLQRKLNETRSKQFGRYVLLVDVQLDTVKISVILQIDIQIQGNPNKIVMGSPPPPSFSCSFVWVDKLIL